MLVRLILLLITYYNTEYTHSHILKRHLLFGGTGVKKTFRPLWLTGALVVQYYRRLSALFNFIWYC